MNVLPITVLYVDNIPPLTLEEFIHFLRERGHSPASVKFLPKRPGKYDRARVEFTSPEECKNARFDLGGLVVNGRKLWASAFKEREHIVPRGVLGDKVKTLDCEGVNSSTGRGKVSLT
jgi:hypothetical protein